MRAALKEFIFRILGKDSDAIVVTFATGDPELARRMSAEIQQLEPRRRHILVKPEEFEGQSAFQIYRQLRERFRPYRIGLAPVLFDRSPLYRAMRRAAFFLAPRRILAYNQRLERHHVRLRTAIASILFLSGVPLDRIFLRPKWLVPWKRDRSAYPADVVEIAGRPLSPRRRRVAVLSPYFPYPLSHGGAVRIFHLLREIAQEFDVFLFAFREHETQNDFAPIAEFCARVIVVGKPRYREPRWSTLQPPEVHEFQSPAMRNALARIRREYNLEAVQVEYTMLAPYAGEVLVEHDVTFDLHQQVGKSAWDCWRWRRFETTWIRRYGRVIAMSEKDRALLNRPNVVVVPNGVDLARFIREIERPGQNLLFIGSFRHFPNAVAYRFFVEQVWPRLRDRSPEIKVTIVAGPDPLLYWREHTGLLSIPSDERIQLLEFVADVRPLYIETNLVIVPTLVSAGTNLKLIEAMAMERAVVSTSCGCAGLGLEHAANVWIADSPEAFADAIETLLADAELRQRIATAARHHIERNFDWREIGQRQRAVLRELMPRRFKIRAAEPKDLAQISAIQGTSSEASHWLPHDYLAFRCQVAILNGNVAGFIVSRQAGDKEREILNLAVHPEFRRLGVASELLRNEMKQWPGTHFLEVRESNLGARLLYERLGFEAVGKRPDYYENPPEAGIVMRVFS